MAVFEPLGVTIPISVLVDGADESNSVEVVDFLGNNGDINREVIIDCSTSEFHQMLVVEYVSGSSFAKLLPLLPHTFVSSNGNKFHIQSLSHIYASTAGGSKTEAYLSDLKKVAKTSGKENGSVLVEVLSQIQQSIAQLQLADASALKCEEQSDMLPSTSGEIPVIGPTLSQPPLKSSASAFSRASAASTPTRPFAPGDLNPPEVQRYVVEHLVRSSDTSMHTGHRLRQFSGKVPRPNHEMDYDTWRAGVELVRRDPAISDLQRTRLIRDSLLPPASDLVKHLSHDALPDVYLQQLESPYGTVQDGDELYAEFRDTYQNHGEKSSEYLQRLQVALQHAMRRGGVPKREMDQRLLAQFCRGCWDGGLITELQLKQRKLNPPPFAEFLLLLRTEEDREAAKNQRMKQHLGVSKHKVTTNAQLVQSEDETKLCSALTSLTKQLSQQMTAIQQQLAVLTAGQASRNLGLTMQSASRQFEPRKAERSGESGPSTLKPGFCFRCGEDGHIKPQCDSNPNPALVSAKRKQFQDKQQKWQRQNKSTKKHLN